MTTNTNEKAPGACDTEGLPTHTNGANFPTADEQGKAFASLSAAFSRAGHAFAKDGTVTYWAARWGLVRYLPTIDAARQFLAQIGGRL